jgi:hypothetical protein
MSDELLDEVEAINSIYDEGTLRPSADEEGIYIVHIPGGSSSLKLQFPPTYPSVPPIVLGTHSSGEHSKRGDAARELALFTELLGNVYQPGEVCLFDTIEELKRRLEEVQHLAEDEEDHEVEEEIKHREISHTASSLPVPPWILSDPIVELRSTFIARVAAVSSPTQAAEYVQHLLATDKRVRTATHNITAWRIKGPNGTSFQDCDDDGETAAGGRLLHLMQLMDLWDVMVVVTRWYGGHKLGPRRFALINTVARDGFVKAGHVVESTGKKKHHGK